MLYIELKVIAVSSNTNSFGLHEVLMMDKEGTGYLGYRSEPFLPASGDIIKVKPEAVLSSLGMQGFEMAERMKTKAPEKLLRETWG